MTSGTVQFFRNEDGRPNLQYDSTALHSRREPSREAARQARALNQTAAGEGELILVVGLGWGYLLDELAGTDRSNLLFYEPLPGVLSVWRKQGRLEELESIASGRLFTDLESLRKELIARRDRIRTLRLEMSPVYRRLFPEREARLRAGLNELFGADASSGSGQGVDRDTAGRFFLGWGRNFARRMAGHRDLSFLSGIQSEAAHLYAGAGPGLAEDLAPLLNGGIGGRERLRAGLYIIAADTALAPLLALGIEPDLILSVDSGPGTAYHFRAAAALSKRPRSGRDGSAPEQSAPFSIPVLTWSAGPACLEAFCDRIHFYRSTLPFDQLLGAGPLETIPEWQNDSRNTMGLALLLAAAAGANRLWSAGADFRQRSGQSHVRGTGYTYFGLLNQSRLTPLTGYRPGGYGEKLTAKNAATVRGLDEMASRLGIELRPFASVPAGDIPAEATGKGELRTRTTDTADLCQFLEQHWRLLPIENIAGETGLKVNKLQGASQKWFRIIKNTGRG